MNGEQRERQRKRRFIDRQVQGAVILQMMRHWLLFFLGGFIILIYFQALFGDVNRSFMGHIQNVLSNHAPLYVVAFCMLPAFINDIIRLSHRFVGPVARVRKELRRLSRGEPVTPIRLRKKDFWQGLATDFNGALEAMERNGQCKCTTVCEDLEQSVEPQDTELVECEV